MKRTITWLAVSGLIGLAGCATYGGYQPAVDNTPIYDQQQSQYQQPVQQLYRQEPVLDKKGRQVYDKYGNPVYTQVPVVDQYGRPVYEQQPQQYQGPRRSVQQDMTECQNIARQSASTAQSAVTGGLMGGALGAATGAAIGAITGNAGSGAAYGAAIGGMGGATQQGYSADQRYKQIYNNCMRQRGHNVLD